MTELGALHSFFKSFNIDVYTTSSIADEEQPEFPYLTYTPVLDQFGGGSSITVNLWYRGTSETEPNAKAREILKALGIGGKVVSCDNGYIWLKAGSPFCQSLTDDSDPLIKRRYINIDVEFLTV